MALLRISSSTVCATCDLLVISFLLNHGAVKSFWCEFHHGLFYFLTGEQWVHMRAHGRENRKASLVNHVAAVNPLRPERVMHAQLVRHGSGYGWEIKRLLVEEERRFDTQERLPDQDSGSLFVVASFASDNLQLWSCCEPRIDSNRAQSPVNEPGNRPQESHSNCVQVLFQPHCWSVKGNIKEWWEENEPIFFVFCAAWFCFLQMAFARNTVVPQALCVSGRKETRTFCKNLQLKTLETGLTDRHIFSLFFIIEKRRRKWTQDEEKFWREKETWPSRTFGCNVLYSAMFLQFKYHFLKAKAEECFGSFETNTNWDLWRLSVPFLAKAEGFRFLVEACK